MTRPASNPYNISKREIKRNSIKHKYQKDKKILERLDWLEKEVVRLKNKMDHLDNDRSHLSRHLHGDDI